MQQGRLTWPVWGGPDREAPVAIACCVPCRGYHLYTTMVVAIF